MKKTVYILPLIIFIFSFNSYAAAEMVSVKGSNVNLRSKPSTNSTVKWEYGYGFPLKVLKKNGDWAQVKDFESDTGWIHRSLISDTPYVIVKSFKNNNRSVNIRKKPSTKSEIVGKAYYGVVFQVLDRQEDWLSIRHESGLKGWIYKKLTWGIE